MTLSDDRIVDISSGECHFAAVSEVGHLFTWGSNLYHQLGRLTDESVNPPGVVEDLEGIKIVKVECGGWHTLALSGGLLRITTPQHASADGGTLHSIGVFRFR
jgi:alpha-tubulin suppressor-like RCC1 family protein